MSIHISNTSAIGGSGEASLNGQSNSTGRWSRLMRVCVRSVIHVVSGMLFGSLFLLCAAGVRGGVSFFAFRIGQFESI